MSEEAQKIYNNERFTPKRCGRPPKADIINVASISVNEFGIRKLLVESSDNEEKYTQPPLKRKAMLLFKKPLLVSENVVHESTSSATFKEASFEKPKIVTQPTEKRRGRPFKTSPPTGNSVLAVQLPSAGPIRMPSLKEKLAIKGKSPLKIVAAESQRSLALSADPSSARSTPSLAKVIQEGSSLSDPLVITERSSIIQSKSSTPLPSPAPTSVKLNGNAPVATAQALSTMTAQPVKKLSTVVCLYSPEPVRKGPTIVRLDSPEEDSGSEDYRSEGYSSPSDESEIARAGIGLADRFGTARGAMNGGSQRGEGRERGEERHSERCNEWRIAAGRRGKKRSTARGAMNKKL